LAKEEILDAIKELSAKKRGSIRQNLTKLLNTLQEGKMRGPLSFTGGVQVYIYPGTLLFLSEKGEKQVREWIEKGIKRFNKGSDIPKCSLQNIRTRLSQLGGLPFIAFKGKTFGLTGLKKDPMFQDLIDELGAHDFYFRPLRHMELAAIKSDRLNQLLTAMPLLR
jgi:hypothetical protein